MIIYFTGTGNSRHIAELIGKNTGFEIFDAAKAIKNGECPAFDGEKVVVFVCPVYAWQMPKVFVNWIEKCTFENNVKAYFVLNCGSSIGGADKYVKELCVNKNFEYMGTEGIVMPENYIAVFAAPKEEKAAQIIRKADEKVIALCDNIINRKAFNGKNSGIIGGMLSGVINSGFYKFTIGTKKFFVTNKCISCGECVDNCMLNNIKSVDGKPVWGNDCTHCMACICKCPTEAIEYGKHTKGLRRYVCK